MATDDSFLSKLEKQTVKNHALSISNYIKLENKNIMNKPINKETYILDDSIAFELMDLLKAKARHFIQLNEYVYRLFDGQSVVTFTTLENDIQVEMVVKA